MGKRDLPDIYAKLEGCKPEDVGIYIRKIPSAHVISVIYHFRHSIKIFPSLQVAVQLLYIVTDVEFDGGMLL